MKLRIEMHDSVVGQVKKVGEWLEIGFEDFVILDIKDLFGFEFETMPSRPGTIRLKNAKYDSLPTSGEVSDANICLGDLTYRNGMPLDLVVKQPCFLHIQQGASDFMIFADELQVSVKS